MGTCLVQAFDASTKIGRSAVLLLLALTGAFAQHPPAAENTIVNSCPPAAVALARFMANQPPDGGTPVETIEIEASLPKLNKGGRLYAIRRIVSARHPKYQVLEISGDSMVNEQLIVRYLQADQRAVELGSESAAITPANYKFRFVGAVQVRDDLAYAFRIIPRDKKQGLINGVLWIDGETGIAARLSGHLVKSPSMFLKRVNVTRENSLREGIVETEQQALARLRGSRSKSEQLEQRNWPRKKICFVPKISLDSRGHFGNDDLVIALRTTVAPSVIANRAVAAGQLIGVAGPTSVLRCA